MASAVRPWKAKHVFYIFNFSDFGWVRGKNLNNSAVESSLQAYHLVCAPTPRGRVDQTLIESVLVRRRWLFFLRDNLGECVYARACVCLCVCLCVHAGGGAQINGKGCLLAQLRPGIKVSQQISSINVKWCNQFDNYNHTTCDVSSFRSSWMNARNAMQMTVIKWIVELDCNRHYQMLNGGCSAHRIFHVICALRNDCFSLNARYLPVPSIQWSVEIRSNPVASNKK